MPYGCKRFGEQRGPTCRSADDNPVVIFRLLFFGYTPPPEFRSHFHALPDCRETARGQPRPSLSAALFPLIALRSTSVLAHPRGRKLLSGGFRLYAVRLRREPIKGRSHAESGAEVRSSTVQQVPIARLRAGHPYLFRAASEKPIGLFEELKLPKPNLFGRILGRRLSIRCHFETR